MFEGMRVFHLPQPPEKSCLFKHFLAHVIETASQSWDSLSEQNVFKRYTINFLNLCFNLVKKICCTMPILFSTKTNSQHRNSYFVLPSGFSYKSENYLVWLNVSSDRSMATSALRYFSPTIIRLYNIPTYDMHQTHLTKQHLRKYLKWDPGHVIEACNWRIVFMLSGAYSGICPARGLKFFLFPGEAQHPLGPENPLKSIDFIVQGGLAPIAPPWIRLWCLWTA